jgi:hypothetical protein
MKNFVFPALMVILLAGLLSLNTTTPQPKEKEFTQVTADDIVDPDFLENEIRTAVMEFIEEAGIDSSEAYIPFSD